MTYPETVRADILDERFGTSIPDPYRWLETDIRRDPDVAAWVVAQNSLSSAYLGELPGRNVFRERLTRLFDHERLSAPEKRGNRYFFTRNSGLDNQSVLFVREGASGRDRVLIDPNAWSGDGTTALAEWAVLLQSFAGDKTAGGTDHLQAATSNRSFTKAAWAMMSSPPIPFTCPFLIIAIVS